jgi:Bacterial protein of unknown function (DUF899)
MSALAAADMPPVVDRASFETQLGELRVREKAHIREGDAIAAARRRLPMVEVGASTRLIGTPGPRSHGRTRPRTGHKSDKSTAPTRGLTDAPSPSGRGLEAGRSDDLTATREMETPR